MKIKRVSEKGYLEYKFITLKKILQSVDILAKLLNIGWEIITIKWTIDQEANVLLKRSIKHRNDSVNLY